MAVLGRLRRRLHLDGAIHGAYAVEMPVHLLRALYVRDRWAITVSEPPRALGIVQTQPPLDAGLADDWAAWWAWLIRLDITDNRLLDQPGRLADASLCPPELKTLLDAHAHEVGTWTTTWRGRFRDEIVPAGTEVEQQLARELSRRATAGLLTIRILPLIDPWLKWVGPTSLIVSQRLREDPKAYSQQARTSHRNQW